MGSLGGDYAGCGTQNEPLGGAGDSAQGTSPFGSADRGIALLGQHGRLGLFVIQVALGSSELGLAGSAIEGEVVERLQISCGQDSVCRLSGFWGWCAW